MPLWSLIVSQAPIPETLAASKMSKDDSTDLLDHWIQWFQGNTNKTSIAGEISAHAGG